MSKTDAERQKQAQPMVTNAMITNRLPSRARKVVIAAALALTSVAVQAQDSVVTPAFDSVEQKIRTLAPSATTVAISETPVDGLLQAQINSDIVYVSADGGYLLQGTLFDIDARVNLTDQAMAGVRRDVIQAVDNPRQIQFSPTGEPAHRIWVFTDIDCGYCRKLHEEMDEFLAKGIEVNYLAYPRAGIGSHSYDKYVSVWCADDPQAALTAAKAGNEPEPRQCDNPVLEQFELGQQLGVTGTPAIITRNGDLIPGYMQSEMLRARLDGLERQASASP
jgi:thiol:disulfide interchange protein DsbC